MTMPLAIITGGAQGIGRATVELLLEHEWRVAVLDRDPQAVAELDERYPEHPLFAMVVDVSDELQVKEVFQHIRGWQRENAQGEGIDLLVNNAGIADPECGPIETLSLEHWRLWQESHLTGAFLCTREAVPELRQRKGAIVNVASTRALQSEPHCESYAAAKGGLLSMTHALAVSLGPDVRVNAICPGWIETGPWQKAENRQTPAHRDIDHAQHPAGRVGEPRDVAETIVFLASDKAGFITGQHINVDGGMTRKMIYAD